MMHFLECELRKIIALWIANWLQRYFSTGPGHHGVVVWFMHLYIHAEWDPKCLSKLIVDPVTIVLGLNVGRMPFLCGKQSSKNNALYIISTVQCGHFQKLVCLLLLVPFLL